MFIAPTYRVPLSQRTLQVSRPVPCPHNDLVPRAARRAFDLFVILDTLLSEPTIVAPRLPESMDSGPRGPSMEEIVRLAQEVLLHPSQFPHSTRMAF